MRTFPRSIRPELAILIVLLIAIENSSVGVTADVTIHEAWAAWKQGDISDAERLARRLSSDNERAHLLFLCSCVRGKYSTAIEYYKSIDESYERFAELRQPLLHCYLHSGQYSVASDFAEEHRLPKARAVRMRAERPLQVRLTEQTSIPFTDDKLSPFFPGFDAEVEGKSVVARLDTGAPFPVMGPSHAKSLGLTLIDNGSGFSGFRRVNTSFGIVGQFKLGDAVLENVPVAVVPTGRHIIFGTNVLQQFLSTVDYPNRQLVLSPRGNKALHREHFASLPKRRSTMPFIMWSDHYMIARGSVGKHTRLNFFVDSGLVALEGQPGQDVVQACLSASKKRFTQWECCGENVPDGLFRSRQTVGLGPLKLDGQWLISHEGGELRHSKTYGGIPHHALLGHAFLKYFSWTLDFDNFQYTFGVSPDSG